MPKALKSIIFSKITFFIINGEIHLFLTNKKPSLYPQLYEEPVK